MVVRVHVWEPPLGSSLAGGLVKGEVGHVSIEVGSDYTSYVPEGGIKKLQAVTREVPSLNKYRNFQEEYKKRGTPHHTIELHGLDEGAMRQYLAQVRRQRYHSLNHNCSTVVANALKVGSRQHWNNSLAELPDSSYWEPSNVKDIAQHLKRTLPQKSKGLLGLGFWGL